MDKSFLSALFIAFEWVEVQVVMFIVKTFQDLLRNLQQVHITTLLFLSLNLRSLDFLPTMMRPCNPTNHFEIVLSHLSEFVQLIIGYLLDTILDVQFLI